MCYKRSVVRSRIGIMPFMYIDIKIVYCSDTIHILLLLLLLRSRHATYRARIGGQGVAANGARRAVAGEIAEGEECRIVIARLSKDTRKGKTCICVRFIRFTYAYVLWPTRIWRDLIPCASMRPARAPMTRTSAATILGMVVEAYGHTARWNGGLLSSALWADK